MNATPSTLTALEERLELWLIDKLRPYERNARTHSADQVAQIAASMSNSTSPIRSWSTTDGILAGHGRHPRSGAAGERFIPLQVPEPTLQ